MMRWHHDCIHRCMLGARMTKGGAAFLCHTFLFLTSSPAKIRSNFASRSGLTTEFVTCIGQRKSVKQQSNMCGPDQLLLGLHAGADRKDPILSAADIP